MDGVDPAWQEDKRECMRQQGMEVKVDDREERYRDWDILQYWFRGVEKFAPWVRKIHFVTYGHLPKWLNTKNPKLHIVNHEDFIPEKYRPTFNSHVIEWNFHRIHGLSDNFVYFNDDIKTCKTPEFFCREPTSGHACVTTRCNKCRRYNHAIHLPEQRHAACKIF